LEQLLKRATWLILVCAAIMVGCNSATADSGSSATALTSAQSQYLDHIQSESATIASSLADFQKLSNQLADNPTLLENSGWKASMAADLATWKSIYQADVDATVPPGLQAIRDKWIQGLSDLDLAATHISRGLDTIDGTEIRAGSSNLQLATSAITELKSMIDQFRKDHGG
jgi:hypothetical protein